MAVAKKTDFSIASIMRESPTKKRKLSCSPDGQAVVYSHHGWIVPELPSEISPESSHLSTTPDGPSLLSLSSRGDAIVSPTTMSETSPLHSTPKPSLKRERSPSPIAHDRTSEVGRTPSPYMTSPPDADRSAQTPSPTPSNGKSYHELLKQAPLKQEVYLGDISKTEVLRESEWMNFRRSVIYYTNNWRISLPFHDWFNVFSMI